MITPIGTLNINQICERKEDLLVSSEDIKALAKNERSKAIDEFTEEAMKRFTELELKDGLVTAMDCKIILREIAEQLKGGADNV